MRRAALVLILSIVAVGIAPHRAAADPLAVEVEDAADHHVAAQGSYRGGLPHSWEWKFGSNRSAVNITGVAAHGMLAAHRLTGQQEHEDTALRAARSLIWAYDRGWSKHRPFTQDIEFLAAAGFGIDAGKWFAVTRGHFTPAAYVELVTQGRKATPAVAGWDLASAIRAAIAVGQVDYARGLIGELLRRRGDWDRADKGAGQLLARASVLWALGEARSRVGLTPEQQRVAEELQRELRAAQLASGAWLEASGGAICTQTTAYAVLGLSRWSAGRRAAAAGRGWLRRTARGDTRFFAGGRIWATTYTRAGRPENDYNAEIQSEVLLALATGR